MCFEWLATSNLENDHCTTDLSTTKQPLVRPRPLYHPSASVCTKHYSQCVDNQHLASFISSLFLLWLVSFHHSYFPFCYSRTLREELYLYCKNVTVDGVQECLCLVLITLYSSVCNFWYSYRVA